ncbi:MAG: hypothetical protein A3A58_03120 [Candidatus Blackburnbacteria bacterium RIFCSPLOWO2_01_FULL_41_27]|uniref:Uncharacterized protein n=2 Tax=Candidatus Blackburniibacteriota TaxID=1817898 RepID=A0A1G1VAM3_9BACT|nr:MAG: hypothetical protein A3F61_01705 [Candidatus Blackburnbacteria bacterium RIFCSPHIGHO2_12_FULL_41_13b]OGY14183.1 MAG: hypothetical protein A3A58_03120 [Candidatus Blackburnbacteria bacterium RIFCSPLOWO2_01_FULL_41_27]
MNNSRGFIEMVLVLVGFLILVGVMVFWFSTQSNKLSLPQTSPSPVADTNTDLDANLEAIEIVDPAQDLKDIDRDLESL